MRASWSSMWRSSSCYLLESLVRPESAVIFARPASCASWIGVPRLGLTSSTCQSKSAHHIPLLGGIRRFQSFSPLQTQQPKSRSQQDGAPQSPNPAYEQGVALARHRGPLSSRDLRAIYQSSKIDSRRGLRLLQILQGRRLNGTLDLPLPPDLEKLVVNNRSLFDDALDFLRRNYLVDEDAAILRRIEEEEKARAKAGEIEDTNLYRPQTGHFGVKRGANDSPVGISVLDQIRAANTEKAKLEEEETNRMIDNLDEKLKKEGKPGGLVKLETQDMSLGRPLTTEDIKNNVYLRWRMQHSLKAVSDVTEEEASNMSLTRRLLPSAIFTVLFSLGMYWYSQYWYEPNRMDRMWPNTPLAAATLMGIILANFFVFAAWKTWPPAWKYLNRYFLSVPGYPYAFSMLGNVFSHLSWTHLFINMFGAWIIGLRLHEDVGRGTFLGIYLSSGVIASFTGLTVRSLMKTFYTAGSGASGCIAGIAGAYLTIHSDDTMTFFLLPESLQKMLNAPGWAMLIPLIAIDILGLRFLRFPSYTVDHVVHLGGWVVGIVSGWWWKKNHTTSSHQSS